MEDTGWLDDGFCCYFVQPESKSADFTDPIRKIVRLLDRSIHSILISYETTKSVLMVVSGSN